MSTKVTMVATLAAMVAVMPAFLTGAAAPLLRLHLDIDQAGIGLAIFAFFAGSALASVLGGRLAEHLGAARGLVVVGLASAIALLLVATAVVDLTSLVLLLAMAGTVNGVAQPTTNLALARSETERPALAFGVKQSAIPLATLFAGFVVPMVGVHLGWRWMFGLGAGVALAAAALVPRELTEPLAAWTSRRPARDGDAATGPLVALAIATGTGSGASTSLGSFLVDSAVVSGMSVGSAGTLLALGSLGGVSVRLLAGWMTDCRGGRALRTVACMLAAGAGGYVLLAIGTPGLVLIGTLVAYGAGWGWTGLLMYAVVRLNPRAPGAATGIIGAGGASGAALGPLVFGQVATRASFTAAWTVTAVTALVAAALVLVARGWLLSDRRRDDPVRRSPAVDASYY